MLMTLFVLRRLLQLRPVGAGHNSYSKFEYMYAYVHMYACVCVYVSVLSVCDVAFTQLVSATLAARLGLPPVQAS